MRCVYLIDEINLIFHSRAWMRHGEEVIYWDQHAAKLGDRMIYCYPNFKTLDCGLRDMADEVWEFWNGGLRNLSGWVKSPDKLFWRRYDGNVVSKEPLVETGTTPQDPRLFACYETRGGLDFVATGQRVEARAKGLPWWVMVLVPVGLGLVIYVGFRALYGVTSPKAKDGVISKDAPKAGLVEWPKSVEVPPAAQPVMPPCFICPFAADDGKTNVFWACVPGWWHSVTTPLDTGESPAKTGGDNTAVTATVRPITNIFRSIIFLS